MSDFGGTIAASSSPSQRQRGSHTTADPLERQLRKILNEAKKRGMNIEESFEHFDENKTGRVNRSQFRRALADLGFKAREKHMDSLMERLDINGDGEIVSCRKSTTMPGQRIFLYDFFSIAQHFTHPLSELPQSFCHQPLSLSS